MGFGRTARGRSFVYHAGTAVDSVGGTLQVAGGHGDPPTPTAFLLSKKMLLLCMSCPDHCMGATITGGSKHIHMSEFQHTGGASVPRVCVPCATFTAGLPGMGQLLPLHKKLLKESKPLGIKPV